MSALRRDWPLVIVGSGPAGISVALAAKRRGIDALIVEKGSLCNTIFDFPERMQFFSTSELLEFSGIPLVSLGSKPTKREVLDYFTRLVLVNKLPFVTHTRVTDMRCDGVQKIVVSSRGEFRAHAVVLATGSYDHPNMLGIEGEELPHVSHYFHTAHPCIGLQTVVVGGKNSAAEAALELYRSGARVTIIHRRDAMSSSIKYWIKPDLENRIRDGGIKLHLSTVLRRIEHNCVTVENEGGKFQVPADAVFLLTGYNPDYAWLRGLGIEFEGQAELPVHNPATLESNVEGIYLAGVLLAGRETSRVFIENSRFHGDMIIKDFANKFLNG